MSEVYEPFQFAHRIEFFPADSAALLRSVPAAPGIFALRASDSAAEPYLTRAADLRRRLRRLLAPPEALDANGAPVPSKRLNLRNRVRFIDYTRTGSDFESTLLLYRAARSTFGPDEARRRLRLHPPYFLRITITAPHPRVYSTNRLSKRSLAETFGPFPSRAAADRYCDAALDLFQLRRCHEDLAPYPDHPGCVYGEIGKCLMPCKEGNAAACTPAQYAAEAQRVLAFFRTRGQSLLDEVAAQRDAASTALDFELAATLHKHWEKVRAAALLSDELVRPITDLRAIILQQAVVGPSTEANKAQGGPFIAELHPAMSGEPQMLEAHHADAAIFLLECGHITGPERLSTLGVRAVREQTAVGSSLFAQPLMLAPVPLAENSVILSAARSAEEDAVILSAARSAEKDAVILSAARSAEKDAVILGEARSAEKDAVILSVARSAEEDAVILSVARSAESKDPDADGSAQAAETLSTTTLTPEDRARNVLASLTEHATTAPEPTIADLCDTLSLFRRWYYRPEKQRTGEVFLPNAALSQQDPGGSWPVRRILNGAARVVLGPPAVGPPVDREAAREATAALKTRVLHAGREGVERTVPVLPARAARRQVSVEVPPGRATDG